MTVHDEKKLMSCKICDAQFTAKYILNRHVATIHEGNFVFDINDGALTGKGG